MSADAVYLQPSLTFFLLYLTDSAVNNKTGQPMLLHLG